MEGGEDEQFAGGGGGAQEDERGAAAGAKNREWETAGKAGKAVRQADDGRGVHSERTTVCTSRPGEREHRTRASHVASAAAGGYGES